MISSSRSPASRVLSRSRIIASSPSGEPDEHVEVLGALAARRGGQQPAVGGGAEADLRERLVGLGGGVGVAQRLVGDQQVPGDRLQLAGVAVEHAVGDEHDAGRGRRARGRSARSCPAIEPWSASDEHLDVGRQRRQPAAGRAGGAARRATGRAAGPRRRPCARKRGVVAARCASARPVVIVLPVPVCAASTPEPTTFSAAISRLAAEQDRVVGERPGARHAHDLAGAGVERDRRARRA